MATDQFSTTEVRAWFDAEVAPMMAPLPRISRRQLAIITAGAIVVVGLLLAILIGRPDMPLPIDRLFTT